MPRGKRSAEEAHQQEKEVPAKGKKQKEKKSETPTAAAAASLSQAVPAAPPTATEEDVLERVRVLDRGVRESRQNINNCVELVEILRQVRTFSSSLPPICSRCHVLVIAACAHSFGCYALAAAFCSLVFLTLRIEQSQYDSGVFRAAKALHRIFQSFKDQVALPLDWRRMCSSSSICFVLAAFPSLRGLYAQTFLFTCNPICPTYQAPATMLILAAALPQGSVHTPEEIFANWLAKHYVAFHEALTELLAHKEPSLQVGSSLHEIVVNWGNRSWLSRCCRSNYNSRRIERTQMDSGIRRRYNTLDAYQCPHCNRCSPLLGLRAWLTRCLL